MDYNITKLLILLTIVSCVVTTLEEEEKYHDHDRKSYEKQKDHAESPKERQETKKYFQDIYLAQLVPDEKEFGHVYEDPLRWEQRFEKINLDDNRHQGKVKWGNDKGGYGEFYFDFNHGGYDNDASEEEKKEEEHKTQYDGGKHDKHENNHNIDILPGRHLQNDVELIPGFKLDKKSPLHGGNYRYL